MRGFGEALADLLCCDRLYLSLEWELELLLSLEEGVGDLLLLRLLAFDSLDAGAGCGGGAVTSPALDVSIFLSGEGSAELGGLLVFF